MRDVELPARPYFIAELEQRGELVVVERVRHTDPLVTADDLECRISRRDSGIEVSETLAQMIERRRQPFQRGGDRFPRLARERFLVRFVARAWALDLGELDAEELDLAIGRARAWPRGS
jgi:hypothetical protein